MRRGFWIILFILASASVKAQDPAPIPMLMPDAIPANPNATSEESITGAPPTTDTPSTPEQAPELERLLSYKSVMYSEEELLSLSKIIEAVKNGEPLVVEPVPVIEQRESLPGDDTPKKYYYYPQFYLKSIIYYGPNNWVFWINNKKISSAKPDAVEGLTVENISAEQISFKYAFLPEDRSDFSVKPENELVTLNAFNRSATFLLHPNQTFSSYNWRIYEGKVKRAKEDFIKKKEVNESGAPSINDVFPGNPPGGPPSMPNAMPPPQAPRPPENNNDTGLGGLLNRYQDLNNRR